MDMDEDKVISKLLEHDDRFERIEDQIATKTEMEKLAQSQNEILGILRRVDQERVFTNEAIRRM